MPSKYIMVLSSGSKRSINWWTLVTSQARQSAWNQLLSLSVSPRPPGPLTHPVPPQQDEGKEERNEIFKLSFDQLFLWNNNKWSPNPPLSPTPLYPTPPPLWLLLHSIVGWYIYNDPSHVHLSNSFLFGPNCNGQFLSRVGATAGVINEWYWTRKGTTANGSLSLSSLPCQLMWINKTKQWTKIRFNPFFYGSTNRLELRLCFVTRLSSVLQTCLVQVCHPLFCQPQFLMHTKVMMPNKDQPRGAKASLQCTHNKPKGIWRWCGRTSLQFYPISDDVSHLQQQWMCV